MKHEGNPFQKPHTPLEDSRDETGDEMSLGDLMRTILRTGEIRERSDVLSQQAFPKQPERTPVMSDPQSMQTLGEIRQRIAEARQEPLPEIPRTSRPMGMDGVRPQLNNEFRIVPPAPVRVPVMAPEAPKEAIKPIPEAAPKAAPVAAPDTRVLVSREATPVKAPIVEALETAAELVKKGKVVAAGAVHRARQQFGKQLKKTTEALEESFPELQSPGMVVMREAVGKIATDANESLKKTVVSVGNKEVSRRGFLAGGAAAAVTTAFAGAGMNKAAEVPGKTPDSALGFDLTPDSQEQALLPELGPKVYDMGKLAGKGAGGLTALYLNMKSGSVIEKKETIDFTKGVTNIWDAKVDVVKKKKPDWANNTKRAKEVFVKTYETRQHKNEMLSLEQLTNRMDAGIQEVNQSLDWKNLNTLKFTEVNFTNLTESDVELVKRLSEKIDGTMLMAYVMTEIMPALKDHKFNIELLEFLSQNAGSLFLICLAAMGDPYLSNGPFQFTSFAVYDVSTKDKRGASAINTLLPKEKRIGGSVLKLQTIDDHIKAGQLFAVYNLGAFISGVRRNQKGPKADQVIDTLWKHLDTLDEDVILKYISAAHHLPGNARTALLKLVNNGFQKDFLDFADSGIKTYAKKSAGGHAALKKELGR